LVTHDEKVERLRSVKAIHVSGWGRKLAKDGKAGSTRNVGATRRKEIIWANKQAAKRIRKEAK